AIEAARAGEQGRGFAVVADAVGQLATRVGTSATDIEALIASIKEQTETSVTTMQAGNREVESGASLVNDTLRHLTAIIGTVQDTARSVKEQAIVSDEIARNMEEVRRIANDMLNASKEAVVQGENLHSLAVGLEESVKGFKLARGGVDGAGSGGLSVGTALTAPPRAQLPVGGRAS
ncbi:MAG TPA: methyl-accepting chemotaxis protein, partial [Myxococcota bacterium]|nr:methyl-accepting chemotaxis protein [Myxococcota bacterium]